METDTQSKSPILGEVISERDACKKVFEREDGSFTSIISPEPVHYYDDGEWIEIDNTFYNSKIKLRYPRTKNDDWLYNEVIK